MEAAVVPLVSSSLAGNHDTSFSYAQAVLKLSPSSTFKLPMHFLANVDCQPGFAFTKVDMARVMEDFCFALGLKFLRSHPSIDVVRLAVVKTWVCSRSLPLVSWMRITNLSS